MGIIDELDKAVQYSAKKPQEAQKEFRPSSYNPFYAYPENLMHNLGRAGGEISKGAQQIGEGDYLSGAFHTGLGALEGFYSPIEAGVQNVTQPLADVTGAPEWALTGAAMLPLGYKSIGSLGRRFMGLGGTEAAASEAAPVAEAAALAEPRIGATNRAEWERSYAERKKAYQEGIGGKRAAQMSEAAERTPPVSPAERFFPETPVENMTAARGEYGYPREPWAKPGPAEEMMLGPRKVLPPPAIRLPDARPKWQTPQAEMGILMPGVGRRPRRVAEEMGLGQLRMSPEQQLPDYSMGTFAGRAAERAGEMKAAREEAKANVLPETRPTRRISRTPEAEPAPPSMSKEEKLRTLEAESMRSLYDAVRTLETSGMESAEAEKTILNNIRAGHMTAVKPNGVPLTAKEAKKLRSLSGLGGVSWVRG